MIHHHLIPIPLVFHPQIPCSHSCPSQSCIPKPWECQGRDFPIKPPQSGITDWIPTSPGGADPQNLCWARSSQLDSGLGWSQMLLEYPGKKAHLRNRNEVSVYSPAPALPREAFHGSQPWKTTGWTQIWEWERTGSRGGFNPPKTGRKTSQEWTWSPDRARIGKGEAGNWNFLPRGAPGVIPGG